MRIETLKPETHVYVAASKEAIELAIGEAVPGDRRAVTLSMPQAEMLAHALGLEAAGLRERQRRRAEEEAHLSDVLLDTEFRLHQP